MYMRSQKGLNCVHIGSYLTVREPYEDQMWAYWAKWGHWRPVGGPYRNKWGNRDFIRSKKGYIGHP